MNCGADSRKASRNPDPAASFLNRAIKVELPGMLVSIRQRAKNKRRFLDKGKTLLKKA
jgi:hypothetical protein